MPSNPLPDADLVTRWIRPNHVQRNDDGTPVVDSSGEILNVYPDAFALRQDEDYLSVTWIGYFGPDLACLGQAVAMFSLSLTRVPTNSVFAVAKVEEIKNAGQNRGHKLRIIHESDPPNLAHAAVRRYPRDDDEFVGEIAERVFRPRFTLAQIGI